MLVYILSVIGSLVIFYFIIKKAVRTGVVEAHKEIERQEKPRTLNPSPLFENDVNKSEQQREIERNVYSLYAKKKLPINYYAPIEQQKDEIRKYVADEVAKINQ